MYGSRKINRFFAQQLGFKTKKALLEYLSKRSISLSSFDSELDFVPFIKKLVKQEKELKELIKLHEKTKAAEKSLKKNLKAVNKLDKKMKSNVVVTVVLFRKLDNDDEEIKVSKKRFIRDDQGSYYKQIRAPQTIHISAIYDDRIKYFIHRKTPKFNSTAFNEGRTYIDEHEEYYELNKILEHDKDYKALIAQTYPPDCIVVTGLSHQISQQPVNADNMELGNVFLFNSDKEGGIYHKYIDYNKNKEAKTFNEIFQVPWKPYTIDNYKINSCFLNILVDTYKEPFTNTKRFKFNGTFEEFCDILEVDMKNDNIGLTINKSLNFFKKYNLGLVVIGVFGIFHVYKPESRNKNISPDTLTILVTNAHCHKVNKDTKSLNAKTYLKWEANQNLEDEISSIDLSLKTDFIIRDTQNVNYNVIYVKNLVDILNDVKQTSDDEDTVKKYIYVDSLLILLKEMVNNKPSYIPDIKFEHGAITMLKFKVGNITGIIENCTNNAGDTEVSFNRNIYEKYHKANDELYQSLFTEDHLSYYNPVNIEVEKKYPMRPCIGKFIRGETNKLFDGVDARKAYTSDFIDIKYFPIYSYFDIWQPYDNHKIEDYCQYIVCNTDKSPQSKILFPSDYSRVTGYKLNRITIDYQVLFFKRPSRLIDVNTKQMIDKLWEADICDRDKDDKTFKKCIFNISSGLLEKKTNSKTFTKLFKNYDEAFYYQAKYGGKVYPLNNKYQNDDYEECEELARSVIRNRVDACSELCVLVRKVETELQNGFVPIKDMIYDIRSLKNYQTYMKLKDNNIEPVAIKTDCIYFPKSDTDKARKLFDLSDEIGCFKIESNKSLFGEYIDKLHNDEPEIVKLSFVSHDIINERDNKEINKVLRKQNTIIFGELPGVGKTYTACKYSSDKKLFVSPYNKLCQNLRQKGHEAVTVHMLLGIGCNLEANKKMTQYDVSGYDCIVFDEIMLNAPNILMKINKFMLAHPKIRFLATGDNNQISPIGMDGLTNIKNKSQYLLQCVNLMFHDSIVLKECKRLKKQDDIDKMIELKKDIFNKDKNVIDTLQQYGFNIVTNLNDVKTLNNVSYFNHISNKVNNHAIKKLVKIPNNFVTFENHKYWKGLDVVCKKHYKAKGLRLFVNYTYSIKKIGDNKVTINEPVSNTDFTFDLSVLDKHFRYSFCNTVHSVQGLTIEDEYTIFDADCFAYASRQWIWTALTRTDDISKISIFKNSEQKNEQMIKCKLAQYFNQKVEGYLRQDKKANRCIKGEFVNYEWICKNFVEQNKECKLCNCPLYATVDDGYVYSNITADRVNESLSHFKTNCIITCIDCNCAHVKK